MWCHGFWALNKPKLNQSFVLCFLILWKMSFCMYLLCLCFCSSLRTMLSGLFYHASLFVHDYIHVYNMQDSFVHETKACVLYVKTMLYMCFNLVNIYISLFSSIIYYTCIITQFYKIYKLIQICNLMFVFCQIKRFVRVIFWIQQNINHL
jgi:hypothetical protein